MLDTMSFCNPIVVLMNVIVLRYLNTTFLGLDGCFKTKLKDRGIRDPDLGTGLAYMVNNKDYAAHLEETCGSMFDKTVGISIALSRFCRCIYYP